MSMIKYRNLNIVFTGKMVKTEVTPQQKLQMNKPL